jgi:excisionase family DNA binding protein
MNDDLLTSREAAEILGVRVTTLGRWARTGTLKPAIRTPGGHRRYGQADVEAFRAAPNAPPTTATPSPDPRREDGDERSELDLTDIE